MSNSNETLARLAKKNSSINQVFVTPNMKDCKFQSKDHDFDGLKTLSFMIEKMSVVHLDSFENDKFKIPERDVLRLNCSTAFQTEESEWRQKSFILELNLQDRSRICNVFINKLAFAMDVSNGMGEWDKTVRISLYKKDDTSKMFVAFFDSIEANDEQKDQSLFPFSSDLNYFEGVPRPKRMKDAKGRDLLKDGKPVYDNSEFDAFYLDLANNLCQCFE